MMLALVGPSNNSGDALLAALLLRERAMHAARSRCALTRRGRIGRCLARRARQACTSTSPAAPALLAAAPIVIDGLFGIETDRRWTATTRPCARSRLAALPVVAVDVPSGVDADTGAIVKRTGLRDARRHT